MKVTGCIYSVSFISLSVFCVTFVFVFVFFLSELTVLLSSV
jgi:hypothetical protein